MKIKLTRERLAGDRVEWSLEVERDMPQRHRERNNAALAEAGEARWRAVVEAIAASGDASIADRALDG